MHVTSVPDRTHNYFSFDIFTTRNDRHFSTEPSEQVSATRRKAKTLHDPPSSFTPSGGNSDAFMEAPACVEATKIDLFGCSIQSQTYGNRSLESYSLISFFEVANHPLNCRDIFLPVYSSRAKKRCNCYLVSGLTHIFHFPSILGMVGSRVQHALGCDCPCWPKPGWCSGRRLGHELFKLENMRVSDQLWGLNLPKWQTLKWWIHWMLFHLLHPSASALKQTDAKRICPSILVATKTFCFFGESSLNTARRCAWPSQVTWRRRLPGPPHQRCCPDLTWIWRGINGEHWFRFQKISFELSRSHGHYR